MAKYVQKTTKHDDVTDRVHHGGCLRLVLEKSELCAWCGSIYCTGRQGGREGGNTCSLSRAAVYPSTYIGHGFMVKK